MHGLGSPGGTFPMKSSAGSVIAFHGLPSRREEGGLDAYCSSADRRVTGGKYTVVNEAAEPS